MIGKISVAGVKCDPVEGKHLKDPYLGTNPSLGACRPDVRERVQKGDHVFAVTGKVPGFAQVVLGGFEVAEKISAVEAYERFPEQRLHLLPDGQVTGNVIVNADGSQHKLDHHKKETLDRRIKNYLVGTNPIALLTLEEIAEGRAQTLDILREVFDMKGDSIRDFMGRGRNMTEKQVLKLRCLLETVKKSVSKPIEPVELKRSMSIASRAARVQSKENRHGGAKN